MEQFAEKLATPNIWRRLRGTAFSGLMLLAGSAGVAGASETAAAAKKPNPYYKELNTELKADKMRVVRDGEKTKKLEVKIDVHSREPKHVLFGLDCIGDAEDTFYVIYDHQKFAVNVPCDDTIETAQLSLRTGKYTVKVESQRQSHWALGDKVEHKA
jgi:hypothetical protein